MKKSKGYFTSLFAEEAGVDKVDETLDMRKSMAFQPQNAAYPNAQLKVDRVDRDNTAPTHDYPTAYPTDLQEDEYNTSKTEESTLPTSVYPCNVKHSCSDVVLGEKNELLTSDVILKYKGHYNERASIFQYEGGLTKSEAEYNAYLETLNEFIVTKYPDILNVFELIIYEKPS